VTPRSGRAIALGVLGVAVLAVVVAVLLSGIVGPRAGQLPPAGSAGTFGPLGTSGSAAQTLIAAGDAARCDGSIDEATAAEIEAIPGAVAALGDNAYENGSPQDYAQCYDPSWGQFKDRTRPVPGNHEYQTPGAAGYFGYFGPSVGSLGQSWYAWDFGAWRIYALDANCGQIGGCGQGSPELTWLTNELATHPAQCVLAYWHQPRFSSGLHGNNPAVDDIWRAISSAGTDIVLGAHDHMYERFAQLDANGTPVTGSGTREFVVGTGGGNAYEFQEIRAGSEVRIAQTFGVLRLTLGAGSYDWAFVPINGGTHGDSGSDSCS
jgi:hypothetical protein